MNKLFSPLTIQKGIVHIGDRPRVFISADYPYYRDDANNWRDRLTRLKSLGIEVVSAYIPWRHHQTDPEMAPDFSGRSALNRNVLGFLSLCADLDLMVVAKPGPFIHAEVNYGGLPNWVCPLNNPKIEALLNSDGEDENWSGARLARDRKSVEAWPLPAPFSHEFLRLSCEWMERVGEQVIRPNQAPYGSIVALQVGNEGIYSNGQYAPWAYDYSPSSLAKYAAFLQEEYRSIENYNRLHGTLFADWKDIPAPRHISFPLPERQERTLEDWGNFQTRYMDEIFREWSAPLEADLPVILNQNPPLETHFGLDAWLTRVEPERWKGFYYGFTNWVGDVSANPSAFDRYILTAKRFPGPNMEENWGFAEIYDPAYIDASTSFYQTLSILNNGATGFNVYTGVGTAYADRNMEILQRTPYPDAAPINADGRLTPKAEIVRWLVMFFDRYGEEFLASRPFQPVAWGLYLPQARVAVWSQVNDKSAPQHGDYLREFQKQMRHIHLDYSVINLETTDAETLQKHAFLFLAGSECMAADVQQKLTDYACNGGRLVLLGRIPRLLDENGVPCEILWRARTSLQSMPEAGYAALLEGLPRPILADGQADIWVRSHPERDLHFVTLLIPAHGKLRVDATLEIGTRRQRVVLSAAPSGGALLRIEDGRITDAIIKGHNAYLGRSVAPHCRLDQQVVGQDQPGDFIQVGSWSANLVPGKPVKHAKKDK